MMIIVIDTSAAAEIVLQRNQAKGFVKHIEDADWVITPTLYISEIANVFWKYHVFEDMPIHECEESVEDAVAIPDEYIHEKELYKEAFAMGCQTRMPIYDMLFLTLARRHNAYLLTLDKKLKDASVKHSIRVL
jgi:predicted nucleic acid-binding protein